MKTIAFVCRGNSFKSIICERFAKELTNDFIIVSAGTNPAEKVNDDGAKIMKAKGLSMSNYKPHPLDELPQNIDYLVKMGCAVECPFVPAKETIDFDMDKYPANTFEEKELIVNLLEKKVKEFIKSITK
ncbi:hypothetical protein [Cetobacterium somerae]|uniref:arsenate reductase/protein-tyrosine-phosphatase family protein n=1 Tax=Cetobacterium somerae TaxID=188913 RepID=UPI003892AF66